MTTQQRRALLWALLLCAAGAHFWHCRWGGDEDHYAGEDLLAVRWSVRASESASRLQRPAYYWKAYVDALEQPPRAPATRLVGNSTDPVGELRPALERDQEERENPYAIRLLAELAGTDPRILHRQWLEAAVTKSDAVRSDVQAIAAELGVDAQSAVADQDVVQRFAKLCADRQRQLRGTPWDTSRSSSLHWLELVADPPLREHSRAAGVFCASGVDHDAALLGGIFLPIALIALAWWLRLGWRQPPKAEAPKPESEVPPQGV